MARRFNYTRLQGRASALMEKFGQGEVLLVRTVNAQPDPATPWIPGGPVVTTYRLDATVERVDEKHLANTLIQSTDDEVTFGVKATRTHINGVAVTASEVEIAPSMTDVIVIDGRMTTIIATDPTPGAGAKVVHTAIVRG